MPRIDLHVEHIDNSEGFYAYAQYKIRRSCSRYINRPQSVSLSIQQDSNQQFSCELRIALRNKKHTLRDKGLYAFDCIDRLCKKLQSLLENRKKQDEHDQEMQDQKPQNAMKPKF